AAAALVAVGSAKAALDPKAIAARLSDVPQGYEVDYAHYVSNADAIKGNYFIPRATSTALLRKWGRVRGYEVQFASRTAGSIATQVDVFRNPVGAHGSFAWTTKYVEAHRLNGLKFTRVSVG